MTANDFHYIGNELELFKHAVNWKNYYGKIFLPYIHGEVLEVGSGIGGTTEYLKNPEVKKWICLEPDPKLHAENKTANCEHRLGTIDSLSRSELFDCILYIDVIEHIQADSEEIKKAAKHLKRDGTLIVLVPAHQKLFSEFDRAVGHFRRYNKETLEAVFPQELSKIRLSYLDSVGFFASVANRLLLKQSAPSTKQIELWDRVMIPSSKIMDKIFNYRFGKTVIGVYKNTKAPDVSI